MCLNVVHTSVDACTRKGLGPNWIGLRREGEKRGDFTCEQGGLQLVEDGGEGEGGEINRMGEGEDVAVFRCGVGHRLGSRFEGWVVFSSNYVSGVGNFCNDNQRAKQ